VAQPKFINTVGRRKTATARVVLKSADSAENAVVVVNGLALDKYFPVKSERDVVLAPFTVTERGEAYSVTVNVRGGGKSGQAGAIRLGIARALQTQEPELRPVLKSAGFLTRDPRAVERKKAGRHKARKSTQFSKR
jgi:small subunit ribosomal protein S9